MAETTNYDCAVEIREAINDAAGRLTEAASDITSALDRLSDAVALLALIRADQHLDDGRRETAPVALRALAARVLSSLALPPDVGGA
jgi:hypothetical protein